ncbi:hypothetical protein NFI96_032607, partial [Prochilodus magdalenae]
MNRLSMDNLTEPITKDLDFQLQDPFLLYRNARFSVLQSSVPTACPTVPLSYSLCPAVSVLQSLSQQPSVLQSDPTGDLQACPTVSGPTVEVLSCPVPTACPTVSVLQPCPTACPNSLPLQSGSNSPVPNSLPYSLPYSLTYSLSYSRDHVPEAMNILPFPRNPYSVWVLSQALTRVVTPLEAQTAKQAWRRLRSLYSVLSTLYLSVLWVLGPAISPLPPSGLLDQSGVSIYGIWFYDKADCQRIAGAHE